MRRQILDLCNSQLRIEITEPNGSWQAFSNWDMTRYDLSSLSIKIVDPKLYALHLAKFALHLAKFALIG